MIAPERLQPEVSEESTIEALALSAAEEAKSHIAQEDLPRPPSPAELKHRLTVLLFPAVLLVFVALYVTCLASGLEAEMALLRAGGASLVLAVLARVAVGIVGTERKDGLSDREALARARMEALREKMMAASVARANADTTGAEPAFQPGIPAGNGGKE
jgi:hypothetical protein